MKQHLSVFTISQWSFMSLISAVLFFTLALPVFAQSATSQCIVTKIGDPQEPSPTLPPSCSTGQPGDALQCSYYGLGGAIKPGNAKLAQMAYDIALKVSVPPVIVLGIMRIETPDKFKSATDEYVQNDYDATTSYAGAIGLMQFMPGTFDWTWDFNKTDIAAKFNKTSMVNYVTPQQSPPPQDSVLRITSVRDSITATTYKIKMDKQAVSEDAPWDEASVKAIAERYHGACPYPGGGGSYCDDLWESVQKCIPTGTNPGPRPTAPPVPDGNYLKALKDRFDLLFSAGFSQDQLKAAWEKMWEVSNTQFDELVRGTVINAVDTGSEQIGCRAVNIRYTIENSSLFKVVLMHELGHIIYNCTNDLVAQKTAHSNALAQEGGVTGYGDAPCYHSTDPEFTRRSEDYAEMIAYYLNPDQKEQTSCNLRPVIPFANGKFPLHFSVAKAVLGTY